MKITVDPTLSILNTIKVTVHEALLLNYISKELSDYFYVLPKIHKPGFPPPGRPIMAAQGAVLEGISKYIVSLL